MTCKHYINVLFLTVFCYLQAQNPYNIPLQNKLWKLKQATISGQTYTYIENPNDGPTLQFTSDKIRGNAGCNAYHSSYTVDENTIKINYPLATKMACENLRLSETTYFNLLTQHLVYFISDDRNQLVLSNNTGDRLDFESKFEREFTPPVKTKTEDVSSSQHTYVWKKNRKGKRYRVKVKKSSHKSIKSKKTKTKDTKTKDTKAKNKKTKDTKAKDTKTKDTKAKDTKAKDTKTKDTKAKDTKAKPAPTNKKVPNQNKKK
jgi:heat shock protein HslJ